MKKRFSRLGVRGQLMLFLSGFSMLILLLVWVLISQFLQPRYNGFIRVLLSNRLDTLVQMIDSSEEPISSRDYWTLTLNSAFWSSVNTAIADGTLDVTNACIDVSDCTLRSVNYIENLHPCLLHDTSSSFGLPRGESNRDTSAVIALRRELFSSADGTLYRILETPSGTSQMVVGRLSADGQYAVLVSGSLAQIGVAGMVLARLLPLIGLTLLVLCLFASWLFSKRFTQPITELSQAARQMAHGNYSVRVESHGSGEMSSLAADFNQMAGEVQRSDELQRDLLANVSHDLRTPLTLIKGYAETVRDLTGDKPEKRTEQLNIIVDETDRLSGLVNSVMDLSKVTSGAQKPNPVRFDMSQLCFEVAGRYDAVCAQNGWTLTLEADRECMVTADPDMMERVLHNLLGNATHHIGPDGVFVLRAIPRAEGGCRVEVEDHGPGIDPRDLPCIFDRYYRSRSDSGKVGTGLGLSITKAILQSHGFRFGVDSAVGKGSVFWFEMADAPLPENS